MSNERRTGSEKALMAIMEVLFSSEIITDKKSLVGVWNKIAKEMQEGGASGDQLVTLRQQFFLGAYTFAKILKEGFDADDREVMPRMLSEIENNLETG